MAASSTFSEFRATFRARAAPAAPTASNKAEQLLKWTSGQCGQPAGWIQLQNPYPVVPAFTTRRKSFALWPVHENVVDERAGVG
jgi:hypothetical protein